MKTAVVNVLIIERGNTKLYSFKDGDTNWKFQTSFQAHLLKQRTKVMIEA